MTERPSSPSESAPPQTGLASAELAQRAGELFGEAGLRWAEDLPSRIASLESAWSIQVAAPFGGGGTCSWVAPAQLENGSEAVLKINYPERESLREADALRAINGHGAARLLRSTEEGLCLLIERLQPGTNLWALDPSSGNATGAGVLKLIWQAPIGTASFELLSDLAEEWRVALPLEAPAAGYAADQIAAAVEVLEWLIGPAPGLTVAPVLLHGDFHPANVLAAERLPWLAIDPKPMVGDPAYDLAQWMGNRCEHALQSAGASEMIRRQIEDMSAILETDTARVAAWAFVKSLAWNWGQEVAELLHRVVEAV